MNEAALNAARYNQKVVRMHDFEFAKDKVLMGSERRSMIISDAEKRVTAIHEAGHALLTVLLPHADPIHKVTIIPRGMALGLTQQLPADEKHNYSRDYLNDQIAILLGGRIAEEITMDSLTTGAGNDLERATELARRMVCEWGMSDAMGPLTFGKKEEQIFLGREIAQHQDYSEDTALKIDQEVKRFVTDNYQRAHQLLGEHKDTLRQDGRRAARARSARRRAGQAPRRRPAARRAAAGRRRAAPSPRRRRSAPAPERARADRSRRSTSRSRRNSSRSCSRQSTVRSRIAQSTADCRLPTVDCRVPSAPLLHRSAPARRRARLGERPLVMGILNVTPDSFADAAAALDPRGGRRRGAADGGRRRRLIDIGGESTRPGAEPVAADEELRARAAGDRGAARAPARSRSRSIPTRPRSRDAALGGGRRHRQRRQRPAVRSGAGAASSPRRGAALVLMHTRGRSEDDVCRGASTTMSSPKWPRELRDEHRPRRPPPACRSNA